MSQQLNFTQSNPQLCSLPPKKIKIKKKSENPSHCIEYTDYQIHRPHRFPFISDLSKAFDSESLSLHQQPNKRLFLSLGFRIRNQLCLRSSNRRSTWRRSRRSWRTRLSGSRTRTRARMSRSTFRTSSNPFSPNPTPPNSMPRSLSLSVSLPIALYFAKSRP